MECCTSTAEKARTILDLPAEKTMPEILQYDFMVRALVAASLTGALAPALGVFMLLKRLSLVADALSHVALAGVAIAALTKAYPPLVALGATSLAAVSIEELRARRMLPGDAALAVFLYGALAGAVVIFSLTDGFSSSVIGYLFGSVLTVTASDLWLTGLLLALTWIFLAVFFRELAQTTFDTDLARISGVRVHAVNIALAVIVGATVSVSMRVSGVLLVGALIVAPALVALRVAKGMWPTVAVAVATGVFVAVAGTVTAFYADAAPGGMVALTAIGTLAVVEAAAFVMRARRSPPLGKEIHRHRATQGAALAVQQLHLPLAQSSRSERDGAKGSYRTTSGVTEPPAPGRTSTPGPGSRQG